MEWNKKKLVRRQGGSDPEIQVLGGTPSQCSVGRQVGKQGNVKRISCKNSEIWKGKLLLKKKIISERVKHAFTASVEKSFHSKVKSVKSVVENREGDFGVSQSNVVNGWHRFTSKQSRYKLERRRTIAQAAAICSKKKFSCAVVHTNCTGLLNIIL